MQIQSNLHDQKANKTIIEKEMTVEAHFSGDIYVPKPAK